MLPMYYYSSFRVVDLYIARQKVQFFSLGAFTVQIGSKRRICRFVWYLSGLLYLRNCIGEVVWNIFGAVFFLRCENGTRELQLESERILGYYSFRSAKTAPTREKKWMEPV